MKSQRLISTLTDKPAILTSSYAWFTELAGVRYLQENYGMVPIS
jgi:hypothetical protein